MAKSEGRQAKEIARRRKRLARLLRKLRAMRQSLPQRDPLLLRIGAAKKEAGRAFGLVQIQIPKAGQAVIRETFSFRADQVQLKAADSAMDLICCAAISRVKIRRCCGRAMCN